MSQQPIETAIARLKRDLAHIWIQNQATADAVEVLIAGYEAAVAERDEARRHLNSEYHARKAAEARAERAEATLQPKSGEHGELVERLNEDRAGLAIMVASFCGMRDRSRDRMAAAKGGQAVHEAEAGEWQARIDALVMVQQHVGFAIAALTRPGWRATHRHVKRGTIYEVIATGVFQCERDLIFDDMPVVIYRGEGGEWWARLAPEFNDGRFETLPSPPLEDGDRS